MPKQKLQCPFCPKISTHGAGLASHIRGSHPQHHATWSGNRNAARPGATADGWTGLIDSLEQQKAAVERALSALRDIDVPGARTPAARKATASKRGGGLTPAGRKRLAEAMKRRWAVKRTAARANADSRSKRA